MRFSSRRDEATVEAGPTRALRLQHRICADRAVLGLHSSCAETFDDDLGCPWIAPQRFRPYNEIMTDIVIGIVVAAAGLIMIVWRRPLAAHTVREQNRFWRTKYGPAEVTFSERAFVLIGVFSLAIALSFWLDLFWLPLLVLGGGVLALNLWRLRRRP